MINSTDIFIINTKDVSDPLQVNFVQNSVAVQKPEILSAQLILSELSGETSQWAGTKHLSSYIEDRLQRYIGDDGLIQINNFSNSSDQQFSYTNITNSKLLGIESQVFVIPVNETQNIVSHIFHWDNRHDINTTDGLTSQRISSYNNNNGTSTTLSSKYDENWNISLSFKIKRTKKIIPDTTYNGPINLVFDLRDVDKETWIRYYLGAENDWVDPDYDIQNYYYFSDTTARMSNGSYISGTFYKTNVMNQYGNPTVDMELIDAYDRRIWH